MTLNDKERAPPAIFENQTISSGADLSLHYLEWAMDAVCRQRSGKQSVNPKFILCSHTFLLTLDARKEQLLSYCKLKQTRQADLLLLQNIWTDKL